MKFIRTLVLGLAALLGLALAAQAQNISIATGGTGGVYYPMGGGLAAVLSKYVPGMQATAEVTGGSVDNLKLIGSGKPYVGFSMSDAARTPSAARTSSRATRCRVRTLVCCTQPHARRHGRRQGHREVRRPQGQARVHRLARQRHRGDGLPPDRGRPAWTRTRT
jgi:TRAP-type uncharacterized transport system substrate-binding protein